MTNTSSAPVQTELAGWLENAVLIESRHQKKLPNHELVNQIVDLPGEGRRLQCSVVPKIRKQSGDAGVDIVLRISRKIALTGKYLEKPLKAMANPTITTNP